MSTEPTTTKTPTVELREFLCDDPLMPAHRLQGFLPSRGDTVILDGCSFDCTTRTVDIQNGICYVDITLCKSNDRNAS